MLACLELVCQYSQLAEAARQAVVVHLAPAMAGAVARRSEQQDAGFLCLKLLCDLVTYAASRLDEQVGLVASGCLNTKRHKESVLPAAVNGQVGQHMGATMERCAWQLLCACPALGVHGQLLCACPALGVHGQTGQLPCLRLPAH